VKARADSANPLNFRKSRREIEFIGKFYQKRLCQLQI
jgi:hypothetical protein